MYEITIIAESIIKDHPQFKECPDDIKWELHNLFDRAVARHSRIHQIPIAESRRILLDDLRNRLSI